MAKSQSPKDTKKENTKTAKKADEAPKKKQEIVRHEDGTIELNLSIPKDTVNKEREKVEEEQIKNVTVSGFRKGAAPKEIARKQLNEEKVREELLKKVITDKYKEAIEKHKLEPILNPQIHIEAFEPNKDVKFTAEVAQEPDIDLGDYKKAISDLNAKSKITTDQNKEPQKPSIDSIVETGLSQAKMTIPKVIIEREAQRLLSQLVDEVKGLGMTLEQYIQSKGLTGEQLQDEYKKRAERDVRLEFFLRKVAEEENITVTDEDINNALSKIEDESQREELKKNPHLVENIVRQQKTIDFLSQI